MAAKLPEIIGIVGPIRAGKTTATKYLVERYGYTSASNSDILRRILDGMKMEPTRSNLAMLGDSIFSTLGNDTIARYRLSNLHLGRIVIDGIRYADELERYAEAKSFKLLGITADSLVRYERAISTSEKMKDVNISRADFESYSTARSELDVPALFSRANMTIYNTGTVEHLHKEIDEILKKWSGS